MFDLRKGYVTNMSCTLVRTFDPSAQVNFPGLALRKAPRIATERHLSPEIIRSSYGMGYKGCAAAVTLLDGGTVPKYVDTGVVAVTQANMNDKNILDLLDPTRLKR